MWTLLFARRDKLTVAAFGSDSISMCSRCIHCINFPQVCHNHGCTIAKSPINTSQRPPGVPLLPLLPRHMSSNDTTGRSFSLPAVPRILDSRRMKSGLMAGRDAATIPMLPSAKAQFSSGTISHVTSTNPEDRGCSKGVSSTVLPIAAIHTLRNVSSE